MFEILKKQGQIQNIALSEIFPNRFQPRRVFDENELFALGESIRQNGLVQPISVRRIKGGFELIAGERRLRACKLIGREKIEAIVYDIGDEESAVWALIENNLTERHARELLRIPEGKERLFAAKFIAEKELNVPETVRYIDRLLEQKKPKRKPPKFVVKDLRLFINTFEHAVEVMNSAGLCAVSTVTENEENLIYTVCVPKEKAFRKTKSPAG